MCFLLLAKFCCNGSGEQKKPYKDLRERGSFDCKNTRQCDGLERPRRLLCVCVKGKQAEVNIAVMHIAAPIGVVASLLEATPTAAFLRRRRSLKSEIERGERP